MTGLQIVSWAPKVQGTIYLFIFTTGFFYLVKLIRSLAKGKKYLNKTERVKWLLEP